MPHMVLYHSGIVKQQKKIFFNVHILYFFIGDPKKSQQSAADFYNCLCDTQHFRQDCVLV